MNVLTVNVGAVTLKLSVVDDHDEEIASTHADPWEAGDQGPLHDLRARLDTDEVTVDAVAHRIVHGGPYEQAEVVDDRVEATLRALAPLAPMHQDRTLDAIATVRTMFASVPHIACFDTTFHRTMPPVVTTYPLPAEWRERWDLRRHGFHGLSHAHVARAAPTIARVDPGARIISCHLGSGVSVCAIRDGRSVDTTMGATPLEGPAMATRSGSVDPGLVTWLVEHGGLEPADVSSALRRRSGLAALSGTSGDMRDVLEQERRGDDRATLALGVYVHRLRSAIGAMAAALDGLDVLAFTGGVGQNLSELRSTVTDRLTHLGVRVDPHLDKEARGDADISAPAATSSTVVVATAEHLTMAREARARVNGTQSAASILRPPSRVE